MNTANLTPQRSRQLAIGLLVLAIIAVIAAIALPAWWLYDRYDRAHTERAERLERFQRIAATRPDIARQLEAMRGKDMRRYFLRPGAAALSAAEAQEAIRKIVEEAGARLITTQALPTKDEGRYKQVSAQVQLAANIFSLRTLLHRIETNVPYLFIDNLMVKTQVPGNFKPGPGAEPEMFVTFDMHGYSLTGNP